jgi:ribonuclease P protein component
MLAKRHRLPIQSFFKKKGRSVKSGHFLLKIFDAERPFSRFGIVISSKVSKKAVERNRIKRQIFNFLRTSGRNLPLGDYLMIVLPAAGKLTKEELEKELSKIYGVNI